MDTITTVFGLRAVIEAIKDGSSFNKIYLQKGLRGDLYYELDRLVKHHKISCSTVPVEKLNRLSKNGNHQGVVAKISPIEFYELESLLDEIPSKNTTPILLLLDAISDVRNFGAIIRTAECVGVDAIIIPKSGNAPLNSDAIKTSAGAAFKIPICKVDHIKDAVYLLHAYNIHTIAATEKSNLIIHKTDLKKPVAIVMGSEHKGVSSSILKLVNEKASLPMLGSTESLNVSVACGAILYEVIRQRLD